MSYSGAETDAEVLVHEISLRTDLLFAKPERQDRQIIHLKYDCLDRRWPPLEQRFEILRRWGHTFNDRLDDRSFLELHMTIDVGSNFLEPRVTSRRDIVAGK